MSCLCFIVVLQCPYSRYETFISWGWTSWEHLCSVHLWAWSASVVEVSLALARSSILATGLACTSMIQWVRVMSCSNLSWDPYFFVVPPVTLQDGFCVVFGGRFCNWPAEKLPAVSYHCCCQLSAPACSHMAHTGHCNSISKCFGSLVLDTNYLSSSPPLPPRPPRQCRVQYTPWLHQPNTWAKLADVLAQNQWHPIYFFAMHVYVIAVERIDTVGKDVEWTGGGGGFLVY